jgi:hypothetical protein
MSKELKSIRTGQSAGEAIGYSNIVVAIGPDRTAYEITANYDDPMMPPKRGNIPTDPALWRKLSQSEEIKNLHKVKIRPFEPSGDASDAGKFWIEFELEDGTRRIDYGGLDLIPELSDTIDTLQKVRLNVDKD